MSKRSHEEAIFRAFVRVEPLFSGEPIAEWHQPPDESDFPDVICRSSSGCRVGVELGEWLNEAEMQAAKGLEQLEASMLGAIGEQGSNITENIYRVWLHPKAVARIRAAHVQQFRDELLGCIAQCDRRWSLERFWHSPQGAHLVAGDLEAYPMLAKYLQSIRLFPRERYEGWPPDGHIVKREWPQGQDWITFPSRCDSFSEDTMLTPLRHLLAEKTGHYGSGGSGFDHLSLVVYYNQAVLYNSPAETLRFKFENAAERASQFLDGDPDPFHSVFLFVAVDTGQVFKVC